ncbi:hypothetical protein QE399_000461 [Paracidovorax wautersii]|uniref:Uncharacterized protein n=1 Tax=Paracidovorax wautersii TaxID=1177982 RepID=A0ABU1I6E1_9BURK|nr:hypothetical protein [Paracidovorax wautersii]
MPPLLVMSFSGWYQASMPSPRSARITHASRYSYDCWNDMPATSVDGTLSE